MWPPPDPGTTLSCRHTGGWLQVRVAKDTKGCVKLAAYQRRRGSWGAAGDQLPVSGHDPDVGANFFPFLSLGSAPSLSGQVDGCLRRELICARNGRQDRGRDRSDLCPFPVSPFHLSPPHTHFGTIH